MSYCLRDYIGKDGIISDLKGSSKQEVIEELLDVAMRSHSLDKAYRTDLLEAIWQREQKSSTGLQNGIAIPHAKTDLVNHLVLIIGRHPKGVDFAALDKKVSKLFVLTLSPLSETPLYLEMLSFLCKKLHERSFRETLLQAEGPEKMADLLTQEDPMD